MVKMLIIPQNQMKFDKNAFLQEILILSSDINLFLRFYFQNIFSRKITSFLGDLF